MVWSVGKLQDVLTDPNVAVKVHVVFAIIWLLPGSLVTLLWLASATAWVSWMSLYAIVIAHWSGYQAAHAELRVKRQDDDSEGADSEGT